MKKQTILVIIIGICIISGVLGYIVDKNFSEKVNEEIREEYHKGFNEGQMILIANIQNTGNIPIVNPETGEPHWVPLKTLCGD